MKIAVAQINATSGDVAGNLRKVEQSTLAAARDGADLVVFPEWVLSGWQPLELARDRSFGRELEDSLCRLAGMSAGCALLVGHACPGEEGGYASAASLLVDGGLRAVFGGTGPDGAGIVETFGLDDVVIGVAVGGPPTNVPGEIDVLVGLCAEEFRFGQTETRRECWRELARAAGVPLLRANLVGGNGEAVFDGGSAVLGPDGRELAGLPRFAEGSFVFDYGAGTAGECAEDLSELSALREALRLGLADFVQKNGFSEAVLGLSGGIDSSLVACIAADALGPEKVTALFMPTRFSTGEARRGARAVSENLGIRSREVPIEELRTAFESTLSPLFLGTEKGTAEENVQARIRGVVQMAYANKFHAMPLATGNRSELAVGYCTLYGDMTGGLAVIGDIPKTMVYRLAEHVNRGGEVIPRLVLRRAPSAELRPGQRDEEDLMAYEILDDILSLYVDEGADPEEIVARGYGSEVVWDVVSRVRNADFKRRQAPPVLRVFSRAGAWPRFPLAFRSAERPRHDAGEEDE